MQIAFQQVPYQSAPLIRAIDGNFERKKLANVAVALKEPLGVQSQLKSWTDLPGFDLSNPAKLTLFTPLDLQPPSECELDTDIIAVSLDSLEGGEWNPWANGYFRLDLTHSEYRETKNLSVHWATKANTSYRWNSSINSPSVAGGVIMNKKCLGVILCTNKGCSHKVIHPKTTS